MSNRNALGFLGVLACSGVLLATTAVAALPAWTTDIGSSRLEFTATQAGAEFTGVFREFRADIRFDPQSLGTSRFVVDIATQSVDTDDTDRDDIIRGPDLFAVDRHPQARYVAERFEVVADGYVATGQLTLRGRTREVPVRFTFAQDGEQARLQGHATIDRLDFGVGQGEWQDTKWVGNEVRVQFDLVLTRTGGG